METKNQSSNSVVEQITTKSINLSCGLLLNLIEEQLTSLSLQIFRVGYREIRIRNRKDIKRCKVDKNLMQNIRNAVKYGEI